MQFDEAKKRAESEGTDATKKFRKTISIATFSVMTMVLMYLGTSWYVGIVEYYRSYARSAPPATIRPHAPSRTTLSHCSGSKAYRLRKGQEVEVNPGGVCGYRYAIDKGTVEFLDPWNVHLFTVAYQGTVNLGHRPNARMSHIRGGEDDTKVVITLYDPT